MQKRWLLGCCPSPGTQWKLTLLVPGLSGMRTSFHWGCITLLRANQYTRHSVLVSKGDHVPLGAGPRSASWAAGHPLRPRRECSLGICTRDSVTGPETCSLETGACHSVSSGRCCHRDKRGASPGFAAERQRQKDMAKGQSGMRGEVGFVLFLIVYNLESNRT